MIPLSIIKIQKHIEESKKQSKRKINDGYYQRIGYKENVKKRERGKITHLILRFRHNTSTSQIRSQSSG